MCELNQSLALAWAFLALLSTGGFAQSGLNEPAPSQPNGPVAARLPAQGEYGGDLELLRRCYTSPRAGESNHYLDLWSPSALPVLARINGLTNNHALIVDSHGEALCATQSGYAFYPNGAMVPPGHPSPCYSARDLATVLGREQAASIHNLLLAGCNREGRFRSAELRRHFPNATNVTHMAAGELAFKPMFYQAIVLPSSEIRTLFGKTRRTSDGGVECEIRRMPSPEASALGAYVADLYLPGAPRPYRTVRAGRELLEPAPPPEPAPSLSTGHSPREETAFTP